MKSFRVTTTIAAPPQRVWDIITDGERAPEWDPNLLRIEGRIAPGETITARVKVERNGFDGSVGIGKADAGRNMPHGVYVDNIGLNGLLIVEGQNERTFFITASKTAEETTRTFHLRSDAEGNQTSWPVILHVRRGDSLAQNQK